MADTSTHTGAHLTTVSNRVLAGQRAAGLDAYLELECPGRFSDDDLAHAAAMLAALNDPDDNVAHHAALGLEAVIGPGFRCPFCEEDLEVDPEDTQAGKQGQALRLWVAGGHLMADQYCVVLCTGAQVGAPDARSATGPRPPDRTPDNRRFQPDTRR